MYLLGPFLKAICERHVYLADALLVVLLGLVDLLLAEARLI